MAVQNEKTFLKEGEKSRIWWVNHGRTFSKAKDGGYLWAPMPVKGGNTFAHWESMTYLTAGDLILNFSGGDIVAFGIAKGTAKKYTEESKNKNMAGKDGWRVDLDFFDFKESISFEEIKPYVEEINQSIAENQPFNAFNAVNNGYLFNFSVAGMNLIAEKFTERIPEKILTYLENIRESDFSTYLRRNGLIYEPDIIKKYILSLHTRSLVVLSGEPGVGKTKLALNYAKYLNDNTKQKTHSAQDDTLLKRRWFKLSYNDKSVINAFEGPERKIDQVRNTMLNDGLIPLGWDNRDLNQKKVIKELRTGDVIIAYQGAYIVGGVGIVTHPHFVDETGDAYDTFCESSKNFIRVEWFFAGPLKIKDFYFNEYNIPGFGVWVDTIHEMSKDQVLQFTGYLENKNIRLTTKQVETFNKNYELVTVGADWKSRENFIGWFDSAAQKYIKTKALELTLNAKKRLDAGNTEPFFLILDEMNSAIIDRYLLDFLTALESHEPIILHDSDDVEQNAGIPKELVIPSNLFLIGTISSSERSHRLTAKVLDNVNVIELEGLPVRDYLTKTKRRSFNKDLPYPEYSEINTMVAAEILEKMADVEAVDETNVIFCEKLVGELALFQNTLETIGVHVSLRSFNEILRYLCIAWTFDNQPLKWNGWADALDAQILQRLLPKIQRNGASIQNQIKCLYCYCFSGQTETQFQQLAEGEFVDELVCLDWQEARYTGTAKKLSAVLKKFEKRDIL